MKNFVFTFILILVSHVEFAQITYSITIKNVERKPMSNIEVVAQNSAKNLTIKANTNAAGTVVFVLTEPGHYTFSYLDVKDVLTTEVMEGYTGNSSRSLTYDPKGVFAEKPVADRAGIVFKSVPAEQFRGQPNMCRVNVHVKDISKKPVINVSVKLVSVSGKMEFEGKSNANGEAIFYVPIGQTFEVDVENIPGLKVFTTPNQNGLEIIETIFYEKLILKETVKGDTIRQDRITQTTGTSSHILYSVNLMDYAGEPLSGEPVYAQSMKGKRVYAGMTNTQGVCSFMLEKGDDYVINLKHESGVNLVEVPYTKTFRNASCSRRYRGSANIEAMIAQQKAEMDRLIEELKMASLRPGDEGYKVTYHDTPVKPITEPLNYLTKTSDGFNLDFASQGPIGTPTLVGNKLFTQEGWYSSNYYCLDATTGKFIWGLELGEGGISPAVYHKGVILINTESCSLYAIDANTGKLLWSKYLSGYLFSTPTADDKNVYVVYNHGGHHVLAAFDLMLGHLKWIQPVDNEVIACPVLDGTEVHIASQSGIYYVFDTENGKMKHLINSFKAVSSPTITTDKIYLTANIGGVDRLIVMDRKTLKVEKKYPKNMISIKISGGNSGIRDQMNFNGSHPIVYQNKVVIITDAHSVMAFDLNSERLLWEQAYNFGSDQLPIIANDKVYLTGVDGTVMAFDLMNGTPELIKKSNGKVEGQPIAKNGLLYLASGGILVVLKTSHIFEWSQWNKDASHNAYWGN